jgi:uncharacterized protein YlzI (FlbEa/FlbD family)
MIKLWSIAKDGDNTREVWLNAAHIIGVELDDGVTCITLVGPARMYVAESVERVVELVSAAK